MKTIPVILVLACAGCERTCTSGQFNIEMALPANQHVLIENLDNKNIPYSTAPDKICFRSSDQEAFWEVFLASSSTPNPNTHDGIEYVDRETNIEYVEALKRAEIPYTITSNTVWTPLELSIEVQEVRDKLEWEKLSDEERSHGSSLRDPSDTK